MASLVAQGALRETPSSPCCVPPLAARAPHSAAAAATNAPWTLTSARWAPRSERSALWAAATARAFCAAPRPAAEVSARGRPAPVPAAEASWQPLEGKESGGPFRFPPLAAIAALTPRALHRVGPCPRAQALQPVPAPRQRCRRPNPRQCRRRTVASGSHRGMACWEDRRHCGRTGPESVGVRLVPAAKMGGSTKEPPRLLVTTAHPGMPAVGSGPGRRPRPRGRRAAGASEEPEELRLRWQWSPLGGRAKARPPLTRAIHHVPAAKTPMPPPTCPCPVSPAQAPTHPSRAQEWTASQGSYPHSGYP